MISGTREAGRGLRAELRRQVASAGLGQRLANNWRDEQYPNQKLDAASLVYTEAPQIVRAFDEAAVIRTKRGRFSRSRPRTRRVPRPSEPSLLVLDGLRALLSRKTEDLGGFRRATERARGNGQGLITISTD